MWHTAVTFNFNALFESSSSWLLCERVMHGSYFQGWVHCTSTDSFCLHTSSVVVQLGALSFDSITIEDLHLLKHNLNQYSIRTPSNSFAWLLNVSFLTKEQKTNFGLSTLHSVFYTVKCAHNFLWHPHQVSTFQSSSVINFGECHAIFT